MTPSRPGRARFLVIGVGNPSRGDDALGALFVERAAERLCPEVDAGHVELLTDFQLQIEHSLDLVGRQRVVFVDASVSAPPPYAWARLEPHRDESATTHAMSPAAVLEVHRSVLGEPPPAWALAIRGHSFELGDGLSKTGAMNLDAALSFFVEEARTFVHEQEHRPTDRPPREGLK